MARLRRRAPSPAGTWPSCADEMRRDSSRLRLWIILRTFVVLARPETVHGEPGKNWRAYVPEGEAGLQGDAGGSGEPGTDDDRRGNGHRSEGGTRG